MAELLRGGQFLVKETKCEDVFTPEDFSEEQLMMKRLLRNLTKERLLRTEIVLKQKTTSLLKK